MSKTAMVTLAHLQNKLNSTCYGLDTGSEDSVRTIHEYLKSLASAIEFSVKGLPSTSENLVISLQMALSAYKETPWGGINLDECLGSHILD